MCVRVESRLSQSVSIFSVCSRSLEREREGGREREVCVVELCVNERVGAVCE